MCTARSASAAPSTCSRIAANAASSSGRWLSSTSSAPSVCRHALRGELHLVERARRIGNARDVEQEHDAVRGRQPQRLGRERIGAQVLQRVQDGAGLFLRPIRSVRRARAETRPLRRRRAAACRVSTPGVGFSTVRPICTSSSAQRRSSDSARATSCAMSGGDERGGQRRRDVAHDADERVDLRARRGAVAIGEQQARDDLGESARRVAREPLPVGARIGASEPAQWLAEPRMQTGGKRAGCRQARPAATESGTRSRDRALRPGERRRRYGSARGSRLSPAMHRPAPANPRGGASPTKRRLRQALPWQVRERRRAAARRRSRHRAAARNAGAPSSILASDGPCPASVGSTRSDARVGPGPDCGHRRARVVTLQAPLLPAVVDDDADHQQRSRR